jgi:hypothetical protein
LWEGVYIEKEKIITNITILGDSMMVVWEIINKPTTRNNSFNRLISQILTLLAEFQVVEIFHIKHELNSKDDYWDKLGLHLNEGTIIKRGVRGVLPIPQSERLRSLMIQDKW